jgi:hypothetical protein
MDNHLGTSAFSECYKLITTEILLFNYHKAYRDYKDSPPGDLSGKNSKHPLWIKPKIYRYTLLDINNCIDLERKQKTPYQDINDLKQDN